MYVSFTGQEATYVIYFIFKLDWSMDYFETLAIHHETNGNRIHLDISSKYCFEETKAHFTETKANLQKGQMWNFMCCLLNHTIQ